jgi:hypothetical protein
MDDWRVWPVCQASGISAIDGVSAGLVLVTTIHLYPSGLLRWPMLIAPRFGYSRNFGRFFDALGTIDPMTSLRQAQTSTLQRTPFFAGTKEYSIDEYHSAYTHYGS